MAAGGPVAGGTGLLEEVLEAHGGLERWRSVAEIRAHARSGGLLLRTRVPGNPFADYEVRVGVHGPRTVLSPFPALGRQGVYDSGRVRIESAGGTTIESRDDPRSAFAGGLGGLRRNLRWDALDAAYFSGYAMWNYLTTPYLLTRDGVSVQEGEPWDEDGETWRRLEVEFPNGIDTHSRHQTFFVDGRGLIRRHDYTAEVVSRWANAAHLCAEHREADGLVFPTRRRVVPRGPRHRPLPGPTVVWIELESIHVT